MVTTTTYCSPFALPTNGVLSWGTTSITVTTELWFKPECTIPADVNSTFPDLTVPFYASAIPQTYVIAATTVMAWVLIVMLIIAPRTSFSGYLLTGPMFMTGHGLIGGATGGRSSLIGMGSRPWLQKVAALTVAISLTMATTEMFNTSQKYYGVWYPDATLLRHAVLDSRGIKCSRVISEIFVWLAQVQTLIRLFPRHKEKVLIKWIGFALIVLDTIFSCLRSFLVDTRHRPRQFVHAIPALSYLFELALGLLYAAWVIYYSLTKRRYAFWNSKMRSISLIAFLSLVSVLTPVVFFIIDIANQDVAGWGDYTRWVGAAAAAVVVWEWVERIEVLEHDENKDGILGREIFDGDEMSDVRHGGDGKRPGSLTQRRGNDNDQGDGGGGGLQSSALVAGLTDYAKRLRQRQKRPRQQHLPLGRMHSANRETPVVGESSSVVGNGATPPSAAPSPADRADTLSAASTVYVVKYPPVQGESQSGQQPDEARLNAPQLAVRQQVQREGRQRVQDAQLGISAVSTLSDPGDYSGAPPQPNRNRLSGNWLTVGNPFKRKRALPPQEVQQAARTAGTISRTAIERAAAPAHSFSRWDLKNRLGALAAETGDRLRDRRPSRIASHGLPVTIIPPQPRESSRTWSPQQQQPAGATSHSAGAGGMSHEISSNRSSGTPARGDATSPSSLVAGASRAESGHSPLVAGGALASHSRASSTPTMTPATRSTSMPPVRASLFMTISQTANASACASTDTEPSSRGMAEG